MKNMLPKTCVSLWIALLVLPISALGQQLWNGEAGDLEWTNALNWTCNVGPQCDDKAPDLTDSSCNFYSQSPTNQPIIYLSADTTVQRVQLRNNCLDPQYRMIQIGTNATDDVTLGLRGVFASILTQQKAASGWDFIFSGATNDYGASLKLRIDNTLAREIDVRTDPGWLTLSCDVSGYGGFTKVRAGQLILSGNNTYFGESIITDGSVSLGNPKGLGFGGNGTTVTAGALDLNGQTGVNEILTLNGTGISSAGALINSSGTPASLAGGVLSSVTVTAGGTGYGSPPTVTFSGGGGSSAAAEALLGLTSASITIDNGGTNYDVAPFVIIDGGGGVGAGATSEIDETGVVTNITVTDAGMGYTTAPTITLLQAGGIDGGGTASANATNFAVAGVRLTDAGSGYTTVPTVGFTGGDGSGATADANFASVTLASDSSVGGIGDITIEPVISGGSGLAKVGANTVTLSAANTYSGNTTVGEGILALGASGSMASSPLIDVQLGAVLDVSAVSGGFMLGVAQTLQGNGTVFGNVTADGTIAPGASVGALAFNDDLTLAGNLSIEVDKSLSPSPSNDVITVSGNLTNAGTGTVTVANLGPTLAIGDSFQIFNQAVPGGETMTVSGGGADWTNNLAVDGSIAVLAVVPPVVPATNLTISAAGPASYDLGGMGAANSQYDVYASTNIALPMSNWWVIGSTNSDSGGVIQFLDPQATNDQRFYRFGQTAP